MLKIWVFAVTAGLAQFAIFGLVAPIPQSALLHGAQVEDGEPCDGIDTTAGTHISFHWWNGEYTQFVVWSCNGASPDSPYVAYGTNGSGQLTSIGGEYHFGAVCRPDTVCPGANVSVRFVGPLLVL